MELKISKILPIALAMSIGALGTVARPGPGLSNQTYPGDRAICRWQRERRRHTHHAA